MEDLKKRCLKNGWCEIDTRLEKTFVFSDFARAAVFFNQIVNPIEEKQNYPRIVITYNRVMVSIQTPEAGKVMPRDYILALAIEELSPGKKIL